MQGMHQASRKQIQEKKTVMYLFTVRKNEYAAQLSGRKPMDGRLPRSYKVKSIDGRCRSAQRWQYLYV